MSRPLSSHATRRCSSDTPSLPDQTHEINDISGLLYRSKEGGFLFIFALPQIMYREAVAIQICEEDFNFPLRGVGLVHELLQAPKIRLHGHNQLMTYRVVPLINGQQLIHRLLIRPQGRSQLLTLEFYEPLMETVAKFTMARLCPGAAGTGQD
jgi:hypothetical protein